MIKKQMAEPIVLKGAEVLKKQAQEVRKDLFGTEELQDMIRRMSASLREAGNGVAIAAPQIGLSFRIFVVRGFVLKGKERSEEDPDRAFINPTIVKLSQEKQLLDEGCLSVPGYHGKIRRAVKATVQAYDEAGIRFERGASGLLAQIFQHECDHLDGVLYIEKAEELFPD
jgi:peptide deformylase